MAEGLVAVPMRTETTIPKRGRGRLPKRRMAARLPTFFVALTCLGLSGCLGGSGPKTSPAQDEEPPPLVPPDAAWGAIEGLVVGPDVLPRPNVTVELLGTNRSATTDVFGYYAILPLDPGPYQTRVNETGFLPITRSVTVIAGLALRLDFSLRDIPLPGPYVDDSYVRRGQIQCQARAVTPAGETNPSCTDAHPATEPYLPPSRGANVSLLAGAEGLVIEVQWTPSVAVNEKLRLAVRPGGIATWRQFEGASVLRVVLGPEELANLSAFAGKDYAAEGGALFFNLYPGESVGGAGATFQQDYTLYVTVFYRMPPDPTYTRIK